MQEIQDPEEPYPDLPALPEEADGHKGLLLVPTFWFLVELVKEGSLL